MTTHTDIKPNVGSTKTSKRLGRGNGSGKGTFCGKGCKGQNARKGSKFSQAFEGGQSPLFIRMPKMRGFTALNQVKYTAVNISTLVKIAETGTTDITKLVLIVKGIIKKESDPVKVLGEGEISVAVTVEADKVSVEALKKIEKAGGKIDIKKLEPKKAKIK
ncbi:MAG: 50S ribosomal protein L15 [Candidatus Gracilibacteria bacterium]|nr:50S ribosomal protein L15 [Candidatus Gracilibacteria bacterium]